jgi:DNA-binding NtrC family response regulator
MLPIRSSVLLVDDEAAIRFAVGDFLSSHGCGVREAATAAEALAHLQTERPDAMVIADRLPDGSTLDVIQRARTLDPRLFIVLLTASGSIQLAVDAVKAGAEQFLPKPVDLEALHGVLQRGLENRRNRLRQVAAERLEGRQRLRPFLGDSRAVRSLERSAYKLAASGSPVLLLGEAGTGKRELARWLHDNGARRGGPFVDLGCAGLSSRYLESELFGHEAGAFLGARDRKVGLLELADGGTLFLDEVADVDPLVQPKILIALAEGRFHRLGCDRDRPVDVRLITSSRHDLGRLEREKKFCSDLFIQVNTIPLLVPPLRERRRDVPVLAQALVDELAGNFGRNGKMLAPEALRALERYDWPGNLRELSNVIERAVLLGRHDVIREADLDGLPGGALPVPSSHVLGRRTGPWPLAPGARP